VALSPNTWYYLSATFDGTTGTLFVDGTPVATATLPGGYAASATPLVLGTASWYNGGHFAGSIDEFSYFNRALTPTEVRSLSLTGSAGTVLSTTAGLTDLYAAGGNALDSAGSNNGTLHGGVTYVPGVVGQAFSFNGQGSYIDLGTGPDIVGTGAFSVALWVKTTATAGMILNQRDAANYNGEYALQLSAGKLNWSTYDGGQYGFSFNSNAAVNDGQWHFIVATRLPDGTGQIWIDGVLDSSQTVAPVPLGSGFHVYLGEDVRNAIDVGPAYSNNFVGQLDDVGIYNTALTPAQIGILQSNPAAQITATTDQRGDLRRVGGAQDIGAVELQYDLAITGSANLYSVAGGTMTSSLTVTNNGPDAASNVVLSNPLPAGTTFVSLKAPSGWTLSTPPVGQGGTVTATYSGSLAAGASASFTLIVQLSATAAPGTVFSSTPTIGPISSDSVPGNNSITLTTTVPTGVDIPGQPGNTMVGQVISPVRVAVVDAHGNPITSDSSTLVTLYIVSGPKGAKLGGTLTVRAVNGWATFSNLTLNLAGTYTLGVRSGRLTPDTSNRFVVAPLNVTRSLKITRSAIKFDKNSLWLQTVTLTNTSGKPLSAPLALVAQGLPHGDRLANAGQTYQGSPYLEVLGSGATLAPGKSVTVTLLFGYPKGRGPRTADEAYQIEVLLGL
jgi:uncharacterized repeat protein (TIGR01451 family)